MDYQPALVRMTEFAIRYLEVGTSGKKDVWLVKALLEIIMDDCDIDEKEPFYCLENGQTIAKSELVKQTEICLPAFLLGIWHFIVVKRRDNNSGDRKMDINTIGSRITQALSVIMPKSVESNNDTICEDETKKLLQSRDVSNEVQAVETLPDIADPKRITVNNYGMVQNQKFLSIETMNGDIHL